MTKRIVFDINWCNQDVLNQIGSTKTCKDDLQIREWFNDLHMTVNYNKKAVNLNNI